MKPIDHARALLARGFAPIPVPFKTKKCLLNGWPDMRPTAADLPVLFNGKRSNIGVMLGEPSGWIVEVDLDHSRAVELGDTFLPHTGCTWGRASKPKSHRAYRLTRPAKTRKWKRKNADPGDHAMILEFRSTGCQTVAPGSTHESGEAVVWFDDGEPTPIDPDILIAACDALGRMVLNELGEEPRTALARPTTSRPSGPARPCTGTASHYAMAALRREAENVAVSREGARNDALNRAAFKIGTLVGGGEVDRQDVETELLPAAIRCGLPEREAQRTIASGIASGMEHPRQRPGVLHRTTTTRSEKSGRRTAGHGTDTHLTDLGNAERFAAMWSNRLRYCHPIGKWLTWDGRRWKHDNEGLPKRLAGETARAMLRAAAASADAKAYAEWALESEESRRISAMVELGRCQSTLVVKPDQLDADPWTLNVRNGTIDLRTGGLGPHRREDYMTKIATVDYDPEADCPLFRAVLNRIFGGHEALIRWVRRFLGYALTGDSSEQILPVFFGAGANGKSVLLDTLAGLMGDYATDAPPYLLTEGKHSEHPTEIADLMGRRLVVASETEDGAAFRMQLVKRLTGDTTLKGRYMHQDYFSFPRTHKLVLVSNNRPRVREDSEAVWRRLRLVPFDVVIPPAERDPRLLAKLRAERPGILAWLVTGCLEWQREGLGESEEVTRATGAYRAAEDQIGRFIDDCCDVDENTPRDSSAFFAPWGTLVAAYAAWAERVGESALGGRRFGDALDRRGFSSTTRRLGDATPRGRAGIRLRTPSAERQP